MSGLAALRFHTLHIPFRQRFRHASAERDATSSLWIEAIGSDGQVGVGEACPRPYVTGETLDTARVFFAASHAEVVAEIRDAASLRAWVAANTARIDRDPAAWCAIELALIDLFSRQAGQTAEAWLGLPDKAGAFQYSAVLGDSDPNTFAATFARYRDIGMTDFKLKLAGELARDREKLAVLRDAGEAVARLRLDANNLWQDASAARDYLIALDAPAFAIEEPLATGLRADLPALAQALNMVIILDESLCRLEELADFAPGTRWIPNLRVSKLGGLLRTLALVDAARARGLPLIVGAQVGETSLLTRVALAVARAAGTALLAQEGAFGTLLLENDVCTPPLMFSSGGTLRFESADPGWGLACKPAVGWLRA
ncbi:MAG: enolase C-terminal domain-like protein [Thiobacillus sp.]|nr:enolase C-terminal domain-like protein [Thiobacillus sp.]